MMSSPPDSGSPNQRMRWTKGNMQVCRKYGARLIKSIFKNKSFSSFDMTMTIFPAVILAALSGIINLTGLIYGFTLKSDYMTIIQSLWESMLKAYFMFFMIGMVTTITEWKRIYCPAVKKILYAFTFRFHVYICSHMLQHCLRRWNETREHRIITLKKS